MKSPLALALLVSVVAAFNLVGVSRPDRSTAGRDTAPAHGAAANRARPSVVLVVFDALPVQLLEDGTGSIDRQRFPNFAALASVGTWYRNATTISESTRFSVPAILDGRAPRAGVRSDYASHPSSIFTLLHGYRMNVWEEATSMCPRYLCVPHGHGDVIWRIKHGRTARFRGAVAAVGGRTPQLSFIHVLLPHEPRQYLPSGHAYARGAKSEPGLEPPDTFHRRFLVEQDLQREILQLEYTDTLLGQLIARMKAAGTWNRSLLAVTSDHGESFAVKKTPAAAFRVGELNWHRAVTRANLQDIAGVAMFVKYPGQASGLPDARAVHTVDLLPTILRETGTAAPAGLVGHALQDRSFGGYPTVSVTKQDGAKVTMPIARWLARAARSRAARISLFGSGDHSLYDFGPRKDLNARAVSDLPAAARTRLRASIWGASMYAHVRPSSGFVPALVRGRLTGGSPGGRTIAIAVNGTVVATAPTYPPLGKGKINFQALVPETALRPGRNALTVYEVAGDALRPLGPAT
jgi:hypothetical protein